MTVEQAFDNRIKRFLKEQPNSTVSLTIQQIENCYPKFNSYYNLFDDFSFKIGIGIVAQEIVNSKTDRIIGYIPSLKYYPDNLLKEEPRVESLINELSPLTFKRCYDYLAKGLLYRIMRVPNLDALISKEK